MGKIKISEISAELGISNKEVIEQAAKIEIKAKTQSSALSEEDAVALTRYILTGSDIRAKKTTKSETSPKKDIKKLTKVSKTNEVKKVETKKIKEVATEKKLEKKLEEKVESISTNTTAEPLSANIIKKRKGLVIIKKKRPLRAATPSVRDLLGSSGSVDSISKKAKKPKKVATKKDTNFQTIDIIGANFMDVRLDSEEEVTMMPDFSDVTITAEEEKKRPQKPQGQRRRPASFRARSVQRTKLSKRRKVTEEDEVITSVEIPEDIRVYEFAAKIGKSIADVIKVLFALGVMVTKNDFLDKDAIEILADEFDIEVKTINPLDEFDYEEHAKEEIDEKDLKSRSPIITIMGHVDHGKTSLLDKIRLANIAGGEHGGITQHVGAYMVEKNGYNITFLDTPGHEAFSAMRARGAQVTDIIVIVVAADDGVQPQTKESIKHAKEAGVPFIVAVNKMDKEGANPDLVKSQLAELEVTPTDWGGDHEFVNISALKGDGIDDLLELLHIQAELLELKANPNAKVKATVVEGTTQKGRGSVATVIVQSGTLKIGDIMVCGVSHGKVKIINDDQNRSLKEVKPGEPAVIVGLDSVPNAGDILVTVDSEKEARDYANKRADYIRQKELSRSTKVTIDELSSKIAEGNVKNLPVILKADVAGSLQALKSSLAEIKNDEVKINVIKAEVGGITQNDLKLASSSNNCVILGFNVRPTGSVKKEAEDLGVKLKTYRVIYDLIDDATSMVEGLLSPVEREEDLGQAEVKDVFNVPKLGAIAGCMVSDGTIYRGAGVRVIRDGVVIYEGEVSSLKRFKDDVKEVKKGYECGIGVKGYSDVQAGDFLESFKIVEEKATL